MIDSPSLELANSPDFDEIRERVTGIVLDISPAHDMRSIEHAFALIETACNGLLLGFADLRTPYHDHGHVLEVVLCSARMLHGLHIAGQPVDDLTIDACLVGALLHDSGYLMRTGEVDGSGAQFTLVHVPRGVVFAETQLAEVLSPELLSAAGKVILATDHRPVARLPEFASASERLAAQVTATADIIGQMANREYLERLLLLYFEFKEAGIGDFADVHDMLEKTQSFYLLMDQRLKHELGGLSTYLTQHFDKTRQVRRNYYVESVGRNLSYLDSLLRDNPERRLDRLKRGGIVDRALHILEQSKS
jgi:hypothetical protein